MRNAIRNLGWAAGGAAVMWLALDRLREDAATAPLAAAARTATAPRVRAAAGPIEAAGPVHADAPSGLTGPVELPVPADPAAGAATPPASGRAPSIIWFPPKDMLGTPTSVPDRRPDDAAGRSAATDLLDQTRITCDFGAGTNVGMRSGDTLIVGAGGQWRGDLMVYDLLEPGAGKARLTGTVGGTGSPTGETDVQLLLYGTRLHFLGLQQGGAYVVTTIYDELDDQRRHVAVMSRHENGYFTYADQFLGACY